MAPQDNQGPWKKNHPGVPREWRGVGSGGNAMVWSDGTHAIKRLKPGVGSEGKARFEREAAILLSMADEPSLRLVDVLEVREREGEVEIVMELMDGSLDKVIDRFEGNPQKAAAALIPVVETLISLAERANAIHHRDIKPSNILYRDSEDNLYIADFGCAYLAEDERLTPTTRAIGAWAYRPPEYSVGRIEQVNEKGDVFGLGKLYWTMLTGQSGVVFPGAQWFGREYDLGVMYPRAEKIQDAMLLISQAVAVQPSKRPSLRQFLEALGKIASGPTDSEAEYSTVELQRAEALIEVEYQQRSESTVLFIKLIHADFLRALEYLHKIHPEVLIWAHWQAEAIRAAQSVAAVISQVAEQESDAHVLIARFRRLVMVSRFQPVSGDEPASFRVSLSSEVQQSKLVSLTITNYPSGLVFQEHLLRGQQSDGIYSSETIEAFLVRATEDMLISGNGSAG